MDGAAIYSEDEVDTYAQVVAACPVAGSAKSRSLSGKEKVCINYKFYLFINNYNKVIVLALI